MKLVMFCYLLYLLKNKLISVILYSNNLKMENFLAYFPQLFIFLYNVDALTPSLTAARGMLPSQ